MNDYMRNYSGEIDQAAADQNLDTNTYANESQDQFQYTDSPLDLGQSGQSPEEGFVKQELNFKALREEVDRIKAEKESDKRDYQVQLDLLRANMNQVQRQPEPPKKMFEGLSDNDVPNVAELRREWQEREQGYQSRLEELQVQQMFPDYAEVIEKFALPLVQQKPHLAEGIQGARNKALFAYELGKMAQNMRQTNQPTINENAQRIVENSRKPGTLSSAGGQGALSKADYYATMSDKQFYEIASKNLEGI